MIPVQCNYKEDSEDSWTRKEKFLKCTLSVFFVAIHSFSFAMWIYS